MTGAAPGRAGTSGRNPVRYVQPREEHSSRHPCVRQRHLDRRRAVVNRLGFGTKAGLVRGGPNDWSPDGRPSHFARPARKARENCDAATIDLSDDEFDQLTAAA
jgi:hypothetical protein